MMSLRWQGTGGVARHQTHLHVKSEEETRVYTDPPVKGYIALSVIGILLILIIPVVGLSIYGP